MEPNRRIEIARYRFRIDAEISWDTKHLWSHVTDISRGGMFIEIPYPLRMPKGTPLEVRLALDTPLKLDCVVRHIVVGRGVGVSLSVGTIEKERFEALLSVLAADADPAVTGVGVAPEPGLPGPIMVLVG